MARVSRRGGGRKSPRTSNRARVSPRRSSRRVGGARSRRAAPARPTTVRVVVQAAPSPVAAPAAVSMSTLKKARF